MAVENIASKQKYDKERNDLKHRHVEYRTGDKVKIFTPIRKIGKSEKFLVIYFGLYHIVRKIGEVDYEVQKGSALDSPKEIIYASRIHPYNNP